MISDKKSRRSTKSLTLHTFNMKRIQLLLLLLILNKLKWLTINMMYNFRVLVSGDTANNSITASSSCTVHTKQKAYKLRKANSIFR